ncbi:response regulator [Anaeromyxobacter sp. Fw109-5]|uniref:response regulator n=1 Tax=Anaeromyxobacter sp. (strain Fw109-5) TaxID=404589 RepID=UPI0000ED898B|nr:response regulator [Anaeromyxobacter sp. Fw109-5]ABS27467.1 response regulator receiver protein [Anaeromyxobacter sp. Fw109-5]
MIEPTGGVVMVIDDDEDWRELVVEFLSHAGFDAVGARHGREALARIGARTPDLIVLDLEMPVMSGWEFRREQLRDPRLAGVPVLVASSADPNGLPADGYLSKPYDAADLLRAIAGVRAASSLAA